MGGRGITPFHFAAHGTAPLVHRTAALCYIWGDPPSREPHSNRSSHTMPKRKTTVTSTFGSPGREGHDSSAFYGTRLYADQVQSGNDAYVENPIGELDMIHCSSCEEMKE